MRGHAYDALVGLAGCDKSLPGMMMAMCRLNVPSIFIYGGSILPGTFQRPAGHRAGRVRGGRQAFGRRRCPTTISTRLEQVACPSAGACGAQFTANTMATVSEAIGLALPYSAGAPAPYEIRDAFCMTAGEQVMELIKRRHPAARHRHPQGAGERRRSGGGIRRLDQCRAASAGHCARMRHRVRPVRRRRSLQKNTLCRGFETGRPLCRQGHVRGWRHSAADEDAARPWLPARRLHDRHRAGPSRRTSRA